MHIDFIDLLRCPNKHEESWLVAAFHRMDGRDVIEAKLGCPVCNAEYFVRDGVVFFGDGVEGSRPATADPAHLAAYLNLTSPGRTFLLAASLAAYAAEIALLTESRAISLNAERPVRVDEVAEIRAGSRIPLADGSLDGAALDSEALLTEADRLLRPGGRLVIPASVALSGNFHELARDENHIVAEKVSELVTLTPSTTRR